MKAMMSGFALMILISIGAYIGLNQGGFSSEAQIASPSVRLD